MKAAERRIALLLLVRARLCSQRHRLMLRRIALDRQHPAQVVGEATRQIAERPAPRGSAAAVASGSAVSPRGSGTGKNETLLPPERARHRAAYRQTVVIAADLVGLMVEEALELVDVVIQDREQAATGAGFGAHFQPLERA